MTVVVFVQLSGTQISDLKSRNLKEDGITPMMVYTSPFRLIVLAIALVKPPNKLFHIRSLMIAT